ncbi:YqgE/AlgH family protein [Pseudobacteriovorax antillogorgiicola]|uniref:UPF0301 protein SAMN06296036_102302 n=1 Tax=Pseudobacteriovorax antillogorgiicola TaxID=1513793 RepID=A0A1Y6BC89_9BACT|nr:YqgE/AlgH family protein [Pseudobacteriovorax antillogorgiicola]TCS58628.1 putative transcriptional regulator [Pseudobacteriovorax antillogorgiicola]SME96638.1 putative transcriptional regulator [Pseudobacteriovorax antillogorgiicola]
MSQSLSSPSLLIALPQLQDPNFVKSVVLLVENNDDGAMGFIINRPSPFSVRDVLQDVSLTIPGDIPSWYGGPVGTEQGVVIHNRPDEHASSKIGFVRISSSERAMKGLIESHRETHELELYSYRFVIGYAGWGQRQLENEMKAGAWIQIDTSFDLIFNTPWQKMWDESMRRIGVNPMDIAPTVQPYLN